MKKSTMLNHAFLVLATATMLLLPAPGHADVTIPNTFSSGTTISSSQMNANFSTLATAMPAAKSTTASVITTITGTSNGTATALVSLSVTPPLDGQILLIGTGTITLAQASTKYNFVTFWLSTSPTGNVPARYATHSFGPHTEVSPGVAQDAASSLCVIDVFPVAAGMTTTFYLNAKRDTTGLNTIWGEHPGLTAIFVPNTLP